MQLGWPSHNNIRNAPVDQTSGPSACTVHLELLWPWFYKSHSYPLATFSLNWEVPLVSLPKKQLEISLISLMVLYKTCNWAVKSLAIGYYGYSKFTCAPGVTGKVNEENLKCNLLNSKPKDCDSKSPKTHIVGNQNNIPRKHCCMPGMFLNSFPGHLHWKPDAAVEEPLIWPSAAFLVLCYVLSKETET